MERPRKTGPLLTPSEAAHRLHVHANTLRRWNNMGVIKSYRIGPRADRRFHEKDIAKLFADNGTCWSKVGDTCSLAMLMKPSFKERLKL